jgi:hypothetical protein
MALSRPLLEDDDHADVGNGPHQPCGMAMSRWMPKTKPSITRSRAFARAVSGDELRQASHRDCRRVGAAHAQSKKEFRDAIDADP